MHRNRRIALSAVAVGSLSLGVIGAAPALAGTGAYPSLSPGQVSFSSPGALANSVSNTFAGWVFGKKGNTTVTSVFKFPTVIKCTSVQSGVGPGSFMITGTTANQAFNGAGTLIECISGSPAAAAVVVIKGSGTLDTTHPLFPGDMIKTTVTTTTKAPAKTTATVSDLTHKFTFTKSGAAGAALQEMIEDDSLVSTSTGKQFPVLNFGQIPFSQGAVGGKALGTVTPRTAFDMKTKTKVLQIQTGGLAGPLKNMFNTLFKHS